MAGNMQKMQQFILDMFTTHNIQTDRLKEVTFSLEEGDWDEAIVLIITRSNGKKSGTVSMYDTRLERAIAVVEFQRSGNFWNFTKLYGEIVEMGEPYITSHGDYIEQLAVELRQAGFVEKSEVEPGSLHYSVNFSFPSMWKGLSRMMTLWR